MNVSSLPSHRQRWREHASHPSKHLHNGLLASFSSGVPLTQEKPGECLILPSDFQIWEFELIPGLFIGCLSCLGGEQFLNIITEYTYIFVTDFNSCQIHC
jgi:hypothetical protein